VEKVDRLNDNFDVGMNDKYGKLIHKHLKNKDPTQEIKEYLKELPDNLGCIFEVDLECPLEFHDFFRAYPLFPEKIDGKLMCTLVVENGGCRAHSKQPSH